MIHSRLFLLVAAAALLTLSACSREPAEGAASSADELRLGLERQTVIKGSVAEGASIKVAYQPELYEGTTSLPFLGLALVRSGRAGAAGADVRPLDVRTAHLSIDVAGDFPGTPDVLVVDADFHVIASTKGVAIEGGAHASLDVASADDASFILVRDEGWVRPMEFDVTVGE
jgi:voltage-gated potassium channel Kch